MSLDAERERLRGFVPTPPPVTTPADWVAVPRWWFNQHAQGSDLGNRENLILWGAGKQGVRVVTNAEFDAQASALAEMQERCAQVCDQRATGLAAAYRADKSSYLEGRMDEADLLAQTIRALGKGT